MFPFPCWFYSIPFFFIKFAFNWLILFFHMNIYSSFLLLFLYTENGSKTRKVTVHNWKKNLLKLEHFNFCVNNWIIFFFSVAEFSVNLWHIKLVHVFFYRHIISNRDMAILIIFLTPLRREYKGKVTVMYPVGGRF